MPKLSMPLPSWMSWALPIIVVGCSFTGQSAAKCRMKNPDISINGIVLTNRDSAIKVVGSSAQQEESEDDLPHARFVSTNGAEELVLFSHYGAEDDEYAEVEVREANTQALTLPDLPIEKFKTGHGIELGMSVRDVQSRFGTCFKTYQKNGNELFFEYEIANADKDPELRAFGYPVYYAEYEFQRGKLARFRFGFAFP